MHARLTLVDPIVAGRPAKVRLSGRADWGEPTDETTIPFDLSIYAQKADVDPRCEPSYGAQLQKAINIPNLGASATITDWVLSGDLTVVPEPPETGGDWAAELLPLVILPGIPNVLLCGYQRYIIDDAAWYQLPVRVRKPGQAAPSCRVLDRRLRRGGRLRLRCGIRPIGLNVLRCLDQAVETSTR